MGKHKVAFSMEEETRDRLEKLRQEEESWVSWEELCRKVIRMGLKQAAHYRNIETSKCINERKDRET